MNQDLEYEPSGLKVIYECVVCYVSVHVCVCVGIEYSLVKNVRKYIYD